ncbi:YncE family protein [Streptomyces sp. ICBB 8177]|uniref:YncE family protein n=1 Tax=Streptomyces sp. ICBB 8177 TaxID=563922 RepID=UPI001F54011E|nr:YncE family protein [Streptomyces sp. ICBB 8177]
MRARHVRTGLLCSLALGVAATALAVGPTSGAFRAVSDRRPGPAAQAPTGLTPTQVPMGPGNLVSAAQRLFTPPMAPRAGAALGGTYGFTLAGMLSPAVQGDPQLVYVPNSGEPGMHGMAPSRNPDRDTVTVIDPKTFKVVGHFKVGKLPQHVTPSWDMRTLWVDASGSDRLVPIDPRTAKPGKPVEVDAPYNLYFTPDGGAAVVMAERHDRIDLYDPHTMALRKAVKVPCQGVNHADFSADGSYFLATCEFSGDVLKYDTKSMRLLDRLRLGRNVMPQDIRLGPDGRTFYVAALNDAGLVAVDGETLRRVGYIHTGAGAHGIHPSRDGQLLYVSNRDAGSVSVVDPRAGKSVATWTIPGGGSPDMGGVSADGRQLWLSGRDNDEVYVFDTSNGRLLARIPVGANPHGLAFFPQPGRYSLGHTGNYR